jgi:hypothetical protein
VEHHLATLEKTAAGKAEWLLKEKNGIVLRLLDSGWQVNWDRSGGGVFPAKPVRTSAGPGEPLRLQDPVHRVSKVSEVFRTLSTLIFVKFMLRRRARVPHSDTTD